MFFIQLIIKKENIIEKIPFDSNIHYPSGNVF